MSINGSIPGPVLHFTEGDTAVILFVIFCRCHF